MSAAAPESGGQRREGRNRFPDVSSVAMALSPSYPVYCLRPELIERTARRFVTLFPGTVLYAVKCNPHPRVLQALYRGGVHHFDTASLTEIAQVAEAHEDAECWFMHPVKGRAVIKNAYKVYGIRVFAVDHMKELEKVYEETRGDEQVAVVVRIETAEAEQVLYHLSAKFGASASEAAEIMKAAHERGLKVGISFHVGSQCGNPEAYESALATVGEVIEASGVKPFCVDVGGGFPARYPNMSPPPLDAYMDAIRRGLKALRLSPTTEIVCEPGRALVANGCSLLTQVQLRKGDRLYINDGIYGSLSETVQGGVEHPVRLIRLDGEPSGELLPFVLNGPTCDSLDVVKGTYYLPADTREGDWIELDRVGAYSNALATHFNGFHPETFVEVFDDPPALRT